MKPPSRRLLSAARRWLAPGLALAALLCIIVGTIVVTSVSRQRLQLDDGTVWVTSLADRRAARLNVRAGEPDATVDAAAARFDVLQQGDRTVLNDGGELKSISAATARTEATADASDETTTMLGGDVVATIDGGSGVVRAGVLPAMGGVDADGPAVMELGRGGRIAVDHEGVVYGYRPLDGMALATRPGGDETVRELGSLAGDGSPIIDALGVVDGVPVAIAGNELRWPGGEVHLDGDADEAAGTFALQESPRDGGQSGWVAVAHAGGLSVVTFKSGSVRTIDSGGSGQPAVPVSVEGCVYAAWSQPSSNHLRLCGPDADAPLGTLSDVEPSARLVFRANHRLVILNDVTAGNVWDPAESAGRIAIQWRTEPDEEQPEQNDAPAQSARYRREFASSCAAESGRIRAVDDEFGVRAGTRTALDVLRNDEQTDCSVLRIASVKSLDEPSVSVAVVHDGRQLQFDASRASPGMATFSYTIDDGRGQTSSARVTVQVSGPAEDGSETVDAANTAPRQIDVPPEYDVERGGVLELNALDGFVDGDGDPIALAGARTDRTGEVSVAVRPDGKLTFGTGSLSSGRVTIQLTVTDGRNEGTGVLYVTVHPEGTLAPTLDPVTARVPVDADVKIRLAPYVHGSSAKPVTLTSVEAPDGTSATMDGEDLSFSFRARTPGTYYVPYTVAQGRREANGLARVEVAAPAEAEAAPVVANDVALLGRDRTAVVEPLANDVDPMGGVLAVTAVNAGPETGLSVAVVDGFRVNVFARRMPDRPVAVTYEATNAYGTAAGTIVVLPPAAGQSTGPLRAADFEVSVRTGGIVSAPALDHVSGAGTADVRLADGLAFDDGFRGLAFVSDDAVRYQAPDEPGRYRARYTVADGTGVTASGMVTFSVHAADAEHKPAPTPRPVAARVAAGRQVGIPIDLYGVDADGDDVTLLGLGNRTPRLGRIVEVTADELVYEAYPDSSGTDEFSYAVEDWTGQRSQARVRVGVIPEDGNTGVHARDDEVTLRPGVTADVPVTANDIADGELTVDPTPQLQGVAEATVHDGIIRFRAPAGPGTAYITYTVHDKAGLADTATLAVRTDPEAPIEPPMASDRRVPATATIGKRSIDVDVSPWIANPSGSSDELTVGVHESAAGRARTVGGTTIRIELTDRAGAVPYTVTNDAGLTSMAFIHVPAYGVFPPTPRPKAPRLTVGAHETLTIPIADHVRVGAGKTVRVESPESVSATKSDGSSPYVDDHTLRFTPEEGYAGPASITFTATDGGGDSDGNAGGTPNRAVITLPITVVGGEEAPPGFSSATIDVQAGEDATVIDLTALTRVPPGADASQYRYTTSFESPSLDVAIGADGRLTASAKRDAAPGTLLPVPIVIAYPAGEVHAGLTIRVVASRRPLARIGERMVKASANTPITVDVLADAYNPFPDEPLTVTGARAEGLEGLGVRVEPDGRLLVMPGAQPGEGTVTAEVEDATHAAERRVTATVRVMVMAAPDPPLLAPAGATVRDGMVELQWTPGNANGSPIAEYRVEYEGGGADCGTGTSCRVTGLRNGRMYRFTVKARNEVGWSGPSNAVEAMPDRVPSVPVQVRATAGYREVVVEWQPPQYEGTPPDGYTVALHGPNGFAVRADAAVGDTRVRFEVPDAAIVDGSAFTATVTARNYVGEGETSEPSQPVTPWGAPEAPDVTVTRLPATGSASESDSSGKTSFGVTVTLRNLRNAGCATLTLGGAADRRLDCANAVNRLIVTLPGAEAGGDAPSGSGSTSGLPGWPGSSGQLDSTLTVTLTTVQPGPPPIVTTVVLPTDAAGTQHGSETASSTPFHAGARIRLPGTARDMTLPAILGRGRS